jgi:Xaa-Pro aminopeptidase
MKNRELIDQKLKQAVAILDELDIDVWLTFARESVMLPDPVLDLILGLSITWHSAFLITRNGPNIAIVGRYDADNIRNLDVYDEVIGYDKGIAKHLVRAIEQLNPRNIALNYSTNDVASDGLSHGNYLNIVNYLKDTAYAGRFVSAEDVVSALRGRKTALEIERVQEAIRLTETLIDQLEPSFRPGLTQRQIAAMFQNQIDIQDLGYAWDKPYNPIVTCGPDSLIGHAAPGDVALKRGDTLHIDVGIKADEYCSDIQRMWYVLEDGESEAPEDVQHAFQTVLAALRAGEQALKPGKAGWEVDEVARETIVSAGYPEYMHAFGHLLGRSAHDGATILGPRWERYVGLCDRLIESGNIFTLELHVPVKGRGIMSLEEDVLVQDDGVQYLSTPQIELRYISP